MGAEKTGSVSSAQAAITAEFSIIMTTLKKKEKETKRNNPYIMCVDNLRLTSCQFIVKKQILPLRPEEGLWGRQESFLKPSQHTLI